MSTTAAEPFVDTIEHLDFSPTCEHSNHQKNQGFTHDAGPATAFIKLLCPKCNEGVAYLACETFAFGKFVLHCHDCDHQDKADKFRVWVQRL